MSFIKNNFSLKLLIAALISLNLTSCHERKVNEPLPGIDNETVMRAVLPYAIELQHDKKLQLEDSVVYYGGHGTYIEKMRLTFTSQSILELKEARDLLVDVVDGLLAALNDNEELGPLISGFPPSADDLEVCIKFESYLGLYVDKMYVHWMLLQDGRSYFYAFDLTNEFRLWDRDCECWHERVEPFYKSRQIVTIEREAEKAYKEKHKEPVSIFSEERYKPEMKTDYTPLSL